MKPIATMIVGAATLLALACSKSTPATAPAADAAVVDAVAKGAPSAEPTEELGADELKPVYPLDAGPPDPLATRYCDLVHVLGEKRKAACCGGAVLGTSALIAGQCVRTLTSALASHAVTLQEEDVLRCEAALTHTMAGCDWVTPASPPMPPECEGVIEGALKQGAVCRSSLECPGGMQCQGLSTIDLGACAAPKATGRACNLAIDTLATFTRQDPRDGAHPECAGYCASRQCKDAAPIGAACKVDAECGRGRCDAGKCTSAALPSEGESCTLACAAPLHCVKGRCAAPKGEGDACEADTECRGACARAPDAGTGTCSKSCPGPIRMRK